MAYNPYNTYKKIVARKGDWHNAKSLGQDPGQYYQAAIPLYQELYDNGYGELADELSRSDYTTSKGLGAKYGLKPDEQFGVDNAFNDMTGNAGESGSQKSVYSGIDPTANNSVIDNFVNQIQNGTDMMNDTYQTAQGIATGAVQTQPSAVTQGLYDAYNDQNNRLNGAIQYDANGNVISGLNTEHYNIGRNQLDYLNNFDVTKQPYYQGIMDAYNLGGYNAAQGAYANGAADNGGNIDSYAAANANRQQLAFTTAGMQQAMAMANQNQQNWQNLYSQMSNDLNNQGMLSLQTLDIAKQMYAADAQERMNALDNAGALASQQMAAAVQAFQSLVQERMNDKGITAEMAMQDKDIAAAREQLEMQLASNERIQEGINALGYYQTDANERMNTENNQTQRYGYDTERDIAGINSQTQLGVAGINRDATLGAAGINANAQLGVAGINRDTALGTAGINANLQYALGKMGYDQALAGFKNQLDVLEKQGQITKEQSQWMLDSAIANNWIPQGFTAAPTDTGVVDASKLSTQDIEDAIYGALMDPNGPDKEALAQMGITQNMTPDQLRYFLMQPPYNRTATDANKIVQDLQKYTEEDNYAFMVLESMFPSVSKFGTTATRDQTSLN